MAEPTRYTFDEAILGVIKERQRREADADRLKQEMEFNNRQLSLLDNYRQQQTALDRAKTIEGMNQDYAPAEYAPSTPSQSGGLLNQKFGIDAFTPDKNYIQKDLIPKPQESQKGASLIPMYNGQVEQNFEIDPVTGEKRVTGYGNFYKPDKPSGDSGGSGGGKPVDISNEVGQMEKLLTLYNDKTSNVKEKATWTDSQGNQVVLDYKVWKALAKQNMTDAMTKAGVPLEGDVTTFIRDKSSINSNMDKQTRRQKLLKTIDDARYYGIPLSGGLKNINDQQYEALRYWAQIGTR